MRVKSIDFVNNIRIFCVFSTFGGQILQIVKKEFSKPSFSRCKRRCENEKALRIFGELFRYVNFVFSEAFFNAFC